MPQRAFAGPRQQYAVRATSWAGSYFWGMGGFLSGELLQAPVPRAENPWGQSARAEAPENHVREHQARKAHRGRYRDVPSPAAEATRDGEDKEWIRSERHTEGNNGASGTASATSHVERGRAQEVRVCESMRRCRVSSKGGWTLPAALRNLVRTEHDRVQRAGISAQCHPDHH